KILYGSDAYDAPELYWLAAKWARRALAEALGVYVEAGQLGREEAVEIARMILYKNSRTLYRIPASP
ncbi:MAG: amidohydrolase family protein, partial [Acidimicrobiia bacterium]